MRDERELILIQHKSSTLSLSYRLRLPARGRALHSIQPVRVHPREGAEVLRAPGVLVHARQQRGVAERRVPQPSLDLDLRLFAARGAAVCEKVPVSVKRSVAAWPVERTGQEINRRFAKQDVEDVRARRR